MITAQNSPTETSEADSKTTIKEINEAKQAFESDKTTQGNSPPASNPTPTSGDVFKRPMPVSKTDDLFQRHEKFPVLNNACFEAAVKENVWSMQLQGYKQRQCGCQQRCSNRDTWGKSSPLLGLQCHHVVSQCENGSVRQSSSANTIVYPSICGSRYQSTQQLQNRSVDSYSSDLAMKTSFSGSQIQKKLDEADLRTSDDLAMKCKIDSIANDISGSYKFQRKTSGMRLDNCASKMQYEVSSGDLSQETLAAFDMIPYISSDTQANEDSNDSATANNNSSSGFSFDKESHYRKRPFGDCMLHDVTAFTSLSDINTSFNTVPWRSNRTQIFHSSAGKNDNGQIKRSMDREPCSVRTENDSAKPSQSEVSVLSKSVCPNSVKKCRYSQTARVMQSSNLLKVDDLMQRNKVLQKELNRLKKATTLFCHQVINNPQNTHLRQEVFKLFAGTVSQSN